MQLTEEVCEFICSGVSITLASRNAQTRPSVARARGCAVVRGACMKIRLLVSAAQAGDVLDDVRTTGTISVTFSVPTTHRTLQLKGRDAVVVPLEPGDGATMRAYDDAFAHALRPLGFSAEFAQALIASSQDEVAIEFTPTGAFQQTPGPAAGAQLA